MHDEFDAQLAVQRRCRRRIRCKATAGQRIPTAAPPDWAIHQELLSMADGAYSALAQRRQGAGPQQKRVIVLRNISSWKKAGPTALYAHYDETVVKNSNRCR